MVICDKFSCNHCEEIFDLKNKLYDHVRNKECQQSLIKSKSVNKIDLTSLFISETIFNNADIVIKKGEITHFAATFFFAVKSIASYKSSLSIFVFVENIAFKVTIVTKLFLSSKTLVISSTNSFFTYRAISSSSFIYELYKKSYFIIVDLYMRYASLSKFIIIRIIIVLLIMFM